ncbi:hypothetical protein BX616_001896 [Lobosporangium transversale]|uniref:Retinoic acid induced 16-like protein-domain-containing protein n=1 Tax=Lobosporangium transversale TaxID=64571 RepID=A0A1Y2GT72_9FUNG|nr:Retinoic acid induced 16-like protein-domain-containing protein [Lobosporangium transversale]KAF9917120.1 hypothetical protein BX616_001896 [Lobosporangium transversale]ORZ16835.1 Retinoic acid induced 16-like protein-domain-containing protein [Lobosporangium transversale]|eukprot:XP_021881770.1 Retinoic acid induced 16-like protein-domain-containing protein [Lobosporangium transversale]
METNVWAKLYSVMATHKVQPNSTTPQIRFGKCWKAVQNGFSTPAKRSLHVQQTEIPMRLKNMVDLLVGEESGLGDAGATGPCMEYLLKHDVLAVLVNNSEGDQPKGIMGETIRTIASMINLLDDRFLVHNAVHKPTVKLLRTCASGTEPQGESYHEDLIELMYNICSKIHGYPELLNIFFHDKQWLTVPQRVAARRIQKNLETMEMLKNLRVSTSEGSSEEELKTKEHEVSSLDQESAIGRGKGSPKSSITSTENTHAIPQVAPTPKSDYEFLLFTYLSKFVHREGKGGDFARTGLLFIMELATGSLGEYIMETDFTSFLSAGVGASYSQLPRKLLVRGGPNIINSMVGTLNDRMPPTESALSRRADIEVSTSTDFQSRLDAFLKLLEFCQDIMMRCPNSEIVKSLLVTFKAVFLENILFPSIMECSDMDGSSVAVISYIDLILQVLEHEALVDLVLGFLMSSEDDDNRAKATPQNLDDAFAEVQNLQKTSPYFTATNRFTLKDLILSRLKSRSQPTVIATLKLLNTLITRHCKYSLKLLSIQLDNKATSFRDLPGQSNLQDTELPLINHHIHELDLFYALISTINPRNTSEVFCNGYESYLRDAEAAIEMHQCFLRSKEIDGSEVTPGQMSALEHKKLRRRSMKYGQKMDLPDDLSGEAFIRDKEKNVESKAVFDSCDKPKSRPAPMHRLLPTDPLLQILLGILSHFFAHSVELNLALTGVITSLAVCPYRSLEGWLLFKSSDVREIRESEMFTTDPSAQGETPTGTQFELGDSEDEDTLPSYLARNNSTKFNKASAEATFQAEEASSVTPFKSFPPFFTMLKTLTQQVDYYRSEIDGFDDFLTDRRRTLLVATELNSAIHSPGLADPYPATDYYQQSHPSAPFGSNESFVNKAAGSGIRSGAGTPNMPTGSPNNMAGFMSPRFTGSSNVHNIMPRTSSLPLHEAAQASSSHPLNTTRPRKSSSPVSLMSSPSNMSFLDPSSAKWTMGKPSNNVTSSSSINTSNSTLFQGRADSDMQHGGSASTTALPIPTHPSRATTVYSASASSYSSSVQSSTSTRNTMASGMVGVTGEAVTSVAGTQPSSWGSFGSKPNPVPNPILLKTMETMMIKPLFPDGFVNDSDSEAEEMDELSEEGDNTEDGATVTTEDGSSSKSSKRPSRKTRDPSTSSIGIDTADSQQQQQQQQQQSAHRKKTVTLGQLLTNVVILEEVVKEVVAVAQVRRGLGVDKVRFL